MSSRSKATQVLARQLFGLSLEAGAVSPARVAGVLEYVEKNRPANPLALLKAYHRLVAVELARSHATVEHAGAVSDSLLQSISASLGRHYGRVISASAKPNPSLIAGLRIRVADDVYESSVAGQLAALAASV